jgi:hypothetical protein
MSHCRKFGIALLGHSALFGYALWATTTSVTVQQIKITRAIGHCGECGFALWAIAQDFASLSLDTHYGPLLGTCLCAMGHCA